MSKFGKISKIWKHVENVEKCRKFGNRQKFGKCQKFGKKVENL